LLWRAEVDPAVLPVRATPTAADDPDALDLTRLRPLVTFARGGDGQAYVALSDGWRRIRLDVVEGRFDDGAFVRLDYLMSGFRHLEPRLQAIRRLARLRADGRLDKNLYPKPPGMTRRIEALQVADALQDGASYRDIAVALFGEGRVRADWRARSDFLLSQIRRRAAEARRMLAGGYRTLLGL
jgi:hypothetical protein